jgi:hypothetical protein
METEGWEGEMGERGSERAKEGVFARECKRAKKRGRESAHRRGRGKEGGGGREREREIVSRPTPLRFSISECVEKSEQRERADGKKRYNREIRSNYSQGQEDRGGGGGPVLGDSRPERPIGGCEAESQDHQQPHNCPPKHHLCHDGVGIQCQRAVN